MQTVYLHGYSGDKYGVAVFAQVHTPDNSVFIDMPGFGAAKDPSAAALHDARVYAEEVWSAIESEVTSDQFHLIGHSHGAMISFILAAEHPDRIYDVTLLCPVAHPRRRVALFVRLLGVMTNWFGSEKTARLLGWRPIVDAISIFSFHPSWSEAARQRILNMRRRESHNYRASSLQMLRQALTFRDDTAHLTVNVPATVVEASDDTVAGEDDARWFMQRCKNAEHLHITGGHLAPIAMPEEVSVVVHQVTDDTVGQS